MTKGERLKATKCREVFPLSLFTIVHRQLPRFTVAPFGALYILFYCASTLFYIIINLSACPDTDKGDG